MMAGLDTRLGFIVGKRTATALKTAFGMATVADLVGHYPRKIVDRGELTSFADLVIGDHVTVLAKVVSVSAHRYTPKSGRKVATRTAVVVTDGQRELAMTFFRQHWRAGQLQPGVVAWFSGRVDVFNRKRQLSSPTFEVLGTGADLGEFEDVERVRWQPIYPATGKVTSKQIWAAVQLALEVLDDVPDPVPETVRQRHGLLPYEQALRLIHTASDRQEWTTARDRLRFDEAFVLQTVLAQRRMATAALPAVRRPPAAGGLLDRFDRSLPFEFTEGQRVVSHEISHDLERPHPMHRLLQGEVGSGKTVVALRAMLQVVDAGGQAALLAPTEVLAAQHHRSIQELLGPMSLGGMLGGDADATRIALLSGSKTTAQRNSALLDAASGAAGIVIGTHALLEDVVQFADLGLVVVDEQHRFGVEQRAALTTKAGRTPPHVLVMTATPIPRTVAMTAFGDLDVSTLMELPLGRQTIQTNVVPAAERPDWLDRAWQRVREEVAEGHQVYVVCARIGSDIQAETSDEPRSEPGNPRRAPASVVDVAKMLRHGPLADLRLEIMHGRLSGDEKFDLMRRFAAGTVDVLVSTTVIEVGVDVPNATVMVVMDADSFGVSQLHQLRGRVGRGPAPGLCLLVTEAEEGTPARDRLVGVAATLDGFALAKLDLESRREGDVLGVSQSGRRSSLRLLSVLRDEDVITDARRAAGEVVEADPELAAHPVLAAAVAGLVESEQASYLEKS